MTKRNTSLWTTAPFPFTPMQVLVRLRGLGWGLGLLLGWLLPGGVAAQSAPAWQFVAADTSRLAGGNSSVGSAGIGMTTDASGNVFVTGQFEGQIRFGSTTLVSAGDNDMFLAKWDAAAGAWAWAVSGGGPNYEVSTAVAVSGVNVYVTGWFYGNTVIAGTTLTAVASDIFVAKYIDNGTSVSNGWAVSDGGLQGDGAMGLAIDGVNVYVTGFFGSGGASIAGTILTGSGLDDIFVAKYIDAGTSVRGVWAASGGGLGYDVGYDVAVRDSTLYVTGQFESGNSVSIAGTSLPGVDSMDIFVARYIDQGPGVRPAGAIADGGVENDWARRIAVSGPNVYVIGHFTNNARFAGANLIGAGGMDMFVAKYIDTGAGLINSWAISGGGRGFDYGNGIAVNGTSVYVVGSFSSDGSAVIAGTNLTGTGSIDVFAAKYIDNGSGFSNGWAIAAGSALEDFGGALALSGPAIYVTGSVKPGAAFGPYTWQGGTHDIPFLAGLAEVPVGLTEEPSSAAFTLTPNPAHHTVRLTNAPAPTAEVVDALGRTVRTGSLAPETAALDLTGLPPGLYVVRCGGATRRLVVE